MTELEKCLFNKCQNKDERNLCEYIFNYIEDITTNEAYSQEFKEEYPARIYTSLLYQILYIDDVEDLYEYYRYCDDIIPMYNCRNVLLLNELLHYVHTLFPNARHMAIENIAQIRLYKHREETGLEIIFWDRGVFLDKFPKELKDRIEKLFSHMHDDVNIRYTTTWIYSHLNQGDDYTYKDNEHPQVEIYFACEKEKEKIISLLKQEFTEENISII